MESSSPSFLARVDESQFEEPPYKPGLAIAYAFGGIFVSIILSGVFAVMAYGPYDVGIPTGDGASIGRAFGQANAALPIETRVPPLALQGLLQIPLWIGLAGAPLLLAARKGRGIIADCRAQIRLTDIPLGLTIGLLSQIVLVPALYYPIFKIIGEQDVSEAARSLTDRATSPFDVAVLALMVVVGAPLFEELFFRGFLQNNLRRWIGFWPAWILASLLFALIHFQVLQFPALMMFGMVAGAVFHYFGRLGPAIFTHMGFNAVTVVALLLL